MPAKPRKSFLIDPPSESICVVLNRTNKKHCEHGSDPCWTRCGVRKARTPRGARWFPIPFKERRAWLDEVDPLPEEPEVKAPTEPVAPAVIPDGDYRTLQCKTCDHAQEIAKEGLIDALRAHWPTCCGKTMELF